VLDHLKSTYGLEADYWSICNEAGNGNVFSATVLQRIAHELGPRMVAAGHRTRLEFPENVNADTSWSYIQAVQNDAALWPFIGLVSWHLYGGNGSRPNIAAFAATKGLPTGQTEFLGATFDDLEVRDQRLRRVEQLDVRVHQLPRHRVLLRGVVLAAPADVPLRAARRAPRRRDRQRRLPAHRRLLAGRGLERRGLQPLRHRGAAGGEPGARAGDPRRRRRGGDLRPAGERRRR